MIPEIWVSRRTLYDSSISYHCYIDTNNPITRFIGVYLTPDGIILQDDTRYGQYTSTTESLTYYSSYSIERVEVLIKMYYDHKQDMIETVSEQFNKLLLMSLL